LVLLHWLASFTATGSVDQDSGEVSCSRLSKVARWATMTSQGSRSGKYLISGGRSAKTLEALP